MNLSSTSGRRMTFLYLGAQFKQQQIPKRLVCSSPSIFPKGHCPHLFISLFYILMLLFRLQMPDISLALSSISDQSRVTRRKKGGKRALSECRKNTIVKVLFLAIFKSSTAEPWERRVRAVTYSNSFHRARNLPSFPFLL